MKKRAKKAARSGFSPTKAELAERKAAGYAPAAVLARAHGASPSGVYYWAAGWLREKTVFVTLEGQKKPAAYKRMGHVWVLAEAVASKVAVPVGAAG